MTQGTTPSSTITMAYTTPSIGTINDDARMHTPPPPSDTSRESDPLLRRPWKEKDGNATGGGARGPWWTFPWLPRSGIIFIMMITVAQSFAQSGMQAVLALYFSDFLKYPNRDTTIVVSVFIFVYNIVAPFGGVLSDRFFGNYRTQFWSAVLWSVGAVAMMMTTIPLVTNNVLHSSSASLLILAIFGLFTTSVGYGIINPIQSVFVGDQYHPGEEEKMIRSFSTYYFYCNVGNLLGECLCPVARQYVGYESVMVAVAIATVASTLVFWMGSSTYRKMDPRPEEPWMPNVSDMTALLNILKIFTPLIVFWSLYYQQSSTWIFQSTEMDRHVGIGSYTIPPDIMPSFNDFLVCVFIPIVDYIIYPLVSVAGVRITPLRKMTAGMVCTVLSFVAAGLLETWIETSPTKSIHLAWQVPQYILISAAEVLVSITGLEFAYSQSPKSMKSTVTALWYIASALGSLLVGGVAAVNIGTQAEEFYAYAIAMAVITAGFVVIAQWYYVYTEAECLDDVTEDGGGGGGGGVGGGVGGGDDDDASLTNHTQSLMYGHNVHTPEGSVI